MESVLGGKSVLLTGGTGFLGRSVKAILKAMGAVVCDASRRGGYDLRNEAETLTALLLSRPSIIIHLAAPAYVERPAAAYRDTLLMGSNVLHAAAIQNAFQERVKLVMVAHPASYTTPEGTAPAKAEEKAFWSGAPDVSTVAGAVAAAQKALLGLCQAYALEHGLSYLFLVPELLYGRGDAGSPVSKMMACLLGAKVAGKKSCTLEGDPESRIPLLYVDTAAQAIVRASFAQDVGGPCNLPAPDAFTRKEVAQTIAKELGFAVKILWKPLDEVPPALLPLEEGALSAKFLEGPRTTLAEAIRLYGFGVPGKQKSSEPAPTEGATA